MDQANYLQENMRDAVGMRKMESQDVIKNIFSEVCYQYAKCLIRDKMSSEQAFYYMQNLYAPAFGKVASTALIRASVHAYLKDFDKCDEQMNLFVINVSAEKVRV